MFKMMDIIAYYKYLFLLSWPSLLAYLAIIIFLVYRFILRIRIYRSGKKSIVVLLRFCAISLFSATVVYVFSIMFFFEQGAWLDKPGYIKGKIEKIESVDKGARLIIKSEENTLELFADKSIPERVHIGDIVELSYLSGKRIVYKCNLLTEKTSQSI